MRVLVVEDEERLLRLVERVLRDEGYVVFLARTGPEALDLATVNAYEAIILDLLLPGLDGVSVCRKLRTAGITSPILMLTARNSLNDRVAGLDAGADDYIGKPFAFEELLARLRAVMRRGPQRQEPQGVLSVGDLSLDPLRHEARRGVRRISLTVREFALLEHLLRHRGQVLTRSQLLDAVWGYDFEGMTGVVDTYIHYLRHKIDDGEPVPMIRTVRGVGYALGS